jgi:hypothetical protein
MKRVFYNIFCISKQEFRIKPKNFRKMFRELMAIRTPQMMTSRSLICQTGPLKH